MDSQRFDALARRVAATRSRRGIIGAAAGGALAALGLRQAAAQDVGALDCTGPRQTCDNSAQCCGGSRTVCRRISRACDKRRLKRDDRCCGKRTARCADSCDCCRGFACGPDNTCIDEDEVDTEE